MFRSRVIALGLASLLLLAAGCGEQTSTATVPSGPTSAGIGSDGCPESKSLDPGLATELGWIATQAEVRIKNGDHLDVAREIDHTAEFPTVRGAEAAAVDLEARGYETRVRNHNLTVLHHSPVTEDIARAYVCEVYLTVNSHNGYYEGWGSMIVDEDGRPLNTSS